MPKTTLLGHPLHPMLIAGPAALLPFSLAMDALGRATGRAGYTDAAQYSLVGGYATALAAAAAGFGDYLAIPSGSRVKRVANVHATLNLGLIGLTTVNLLVRRGSRGPAGNLPLALSAVGVGSLFVSAWYGAQLVYKHGMRVEGVDPVEDAPEVKPPADDKVAARLENAADAMPDDGPHATPGG